MNICSRRHMARSEAQRVQPRLVTRSEAQLVKSKTKPRFSSLLYKNQDLWVGDIGPVLTVVAASSGTQRRTL
jgi:hypothetical protein